MGKRVRVAASVFVASAVGVLCSVYAVAAVASPDSLTVYLMDPAPSRVVSSLRASLAIMPDVERVTYLASEPALVEFAREMAVDPEWDAPQLEGPRMACALRIELSHPWNLWATRRVVRAVRTEPEVNESMRRMLPWWLEMSGDE